MNNEAYALAHDLIRKRFERKLYRVLKKLLDHQSTLFFDSLINNDLMPYYVFEMDLQKVIESNLIPLFAYQEKKIINYLQKLQKQKDDRGEPTIAKPQVNIGFGNEWHKSLVRQYLLKAGDKITKMTEYSKQIIRDLLFENPFDGQAKNGRALLKKSLEINKHRAYTIARTEAGTAMGYISDKTAKQQGVKTKSWINTVDLRTRQSHLSMSDLPIKVNDKFNVGGDLLEYAGDPAGGARNVINCRCTTIYGY